MRHAGERDGGEKAMRKAGSLTPAGHVGNLLWDHLRED
jgi:hypothetical protein